MNKLVCAGVSGSSSNTRRLRILQRGKRNVVLAMQNQNRLGEDNALRIEAGFDSIGPLHVLRKQTRRHAQSCLAGPSPVRGTAEATGGEVWMKGGGSRTARRSQAPAASGAAAKQETEDSAVLSEPPSRSFTRNARSLRVRRLRHEPLSPNTQRERRGKPSSTEEWTETQGDTDTQGSAQ